MPQHTPDHLAVPRYPERWVFRAGFVVYGAFCGAAIMAIESPSYALFDLLGLLNILTLTVGMLGGLVAIVTPAAGRGRASRPAATTAPASLRHAAK